MSGPEPAWPSLTLALAGLRLRLHCSDPALLQGLRARCAGFLAPEEPGTPDARLRVQVSGEGAASGCEAARLDFPGGGLRWEAPGCRGELAPGAREGALTLHSARPLQDCDAFLRLACALLAERAGGLLFHAAGVVRQGRAYLFFGPSGSGKTTAARLSRGCRVLNDDLLVLLPCGAGWEAHATPFWNPSQVRPAPGCAPAAGLYRLVQDRRVYLENPGPGLALAELLACVPVLPLDPARAPALLDRCRRLLESLPARRLHFLPDASFWECLLREEARAAGGPHPDTG